MALRRLNASLDASRDPGYAEQPLRTVLDAFSAGQPVPGSGSANAVGASVAAALVASVARKTTSKDSLRYLSVRETMNTIARQADRIRERLIELIDLDAEVFAPVIAIRRETGRLSDPVLQDDSLRAEIASLRPATEIPQEIAERSIQIALHAEKLYEIGFAPAKGESFTALASAIAAAESSLMVAEMNIGTVRTRVARLNDPQLEADWLALMKVRNQRLRVRLRPLKHRHIQLTKDLSEETAPPALQRTVTRRRRPAAK